MKIFVEWQDRWFKFHRFGYYHNRLSAYTVAKSQAKAKQKKFGWWILMVPSLISFTPERC